jgi:hypothetical protein
VTEPITIAVALACLLLAVLTGVSFLPRPPALDAERWFKLWFVTLLRGRYNERSDKDWVSAVLRFVPYHPAGRQPEQKLLRPEIYSAVGPALDGELALVEALSRLSTVSERVQRMYFEDETALDARLEDPVFLGRSYLPSEWLGPDASWDAVADWASEAGAIQGAVERAGLKWVLVEGAPNDLPDALGGLRELLGDAAVTVPWARPSSAAGVTPSDAVRAQMMTRRGDADFVDRAMSVLAALRQHTPRLADRVVVVAVGEGAQLVLEALVSDAELRDRLAAVLCIGGIVGGLDDVTGPWSWEACTDWLQANFTHKALDLEMNRSVPWMSLQWFDGEQPHLGAAGVPLERQRWVQPMDSTSEHHWIEIEDLGVLPADPEMPVDLLARAIAGMVTCWVSTRA